MENRKVKQNQKKKIYFSLFRLTMDYFDQPKKVFKTSGIDLDYVNSSFLIGTEEEMECSCCFDDFQGKEMFSLPCKHFLCGGCWKNYNEVGIKDGTQCLSLKCPYPKCNLVVSEVMIKKTVSKELFEKYNKYLMRSFIDDDPNIQWCPNPKCGKVIYSNSNSTNVLCSCGICFCFQCNEIGHAPLACKHFKEWELKRKNDSATAHFIVQNTKACPKCNKSIEKNGGCNYIGCVCGHGFCFAKGTLVLMEDGTERKIEDIKVGEKVLGDDSTPRKVISTQVGKDVLYKIQQKTNHKNSEELEKIEFVCNSKHLLVVETPKFVSEITTKIDNRMDPSEAYEYFTYNELIKLTINQNDNNERTFDMVVRKKRSIYHKKNGGEDNAKKLAENERDDIIKKNNEEHFKWLIEARNIEYIDQKIRQSTTQSWAPILIEKKNFQNFCIDELKIKKENISKIFYLLGLWTGDGFTDRPRIAVNIKDKDQHERIQDYCKDLGLKATEVYQSEKQKASFTFSGYVDIYSTGKNNEKRNHTKFNVLWDLILSFGVDENMKKSISKDIHFQDIYIREHFLAGLIDSDGTFKQDQNVVVIATIYDKIKNGLIQLAKSLGIRVSVSIQNEFVDNCQVHHKLAYFVSLSMCSALQNILSKCSITGKYYKDGGSKLKYIPPPQKVQYSNQPFYFHCEKVQEFVNIQKKQKISVENISNDTIRELMKQNNNFGYSYRKMESLSKEKEKLEQVNVSTINCYINGIHQESPRSRAVCLFILNENYEKVKHSLDTKRLKITKEYDYYGITLDENSNKLFLLNNNCVVHNCWVCLGPHDHNMSAHVCQKYQEGESKETERKMLEKYIFYFTRYKTHEQSEELEEKLRTSTEEKRKELMQNQKGSYLELDHLINAMEQLFECRKILKFTYPYSYFLTGKNEKNLFDYLQQELETNTEELSYLLENKATDKQSIINSAKVAKTRLEHLLEGVSKGI